MKTNPSARRVWRIRYVLLCLSVAGLAGFEYQAARAAAARWGQVTGVRTEPREETAYIEACNAAREISPAAVPAVLEFVKAAPAAGASSWDREKTVRLRMGAIDLLGRMGPNAKSAVPALRQLANEGNESWRREITEALQRIELNPQEL